MSGNWGRFRANTAYHQMTVLHDDGLYRHLRFRRPAPGSSSYWFDLITWPGHLTVDGDCGTYTFARTEDMFQFFRRDHGINPGYWSEKIRNGHGNPQDSARSYSEDVFRRLVNEAVEDAGDEWPGLAKDIAEKFYGWSSEYNLEDEGEARRALDEYKYEGFRFYDTWEWNFAEWDWTFLWCCHALQWGISRYDAQRLAGAS